MKKTTTIGITGVCGFVGSNLAERLVSMNYHVIGIDDLSKGNRRNINSLIGKKNFEFRKLKTQNHKQLKKVFKKAEVIFHLSSAKIPRYGDRLLTLIENSKGMESVLETARVNKSKVIFTSTSDVYGKNTQLPFTEDSNLVLGSSEVARWAYAATKIFDEHLCFAYQEQYKTKIVILRLFGVYGPKQHLTWWGGPQALFIDNISKGRNVEIHGDGSQTRTFVYIDDVIDALVKLISNPSAIGQIINIGTTQEITIVNLARMIAKILKKKLIVKRVPYKSFTGKKYEDVLKRKPSITKANKLLNWSPKTELKSGLEKTIQWQLDQ
ncbi:MAG: NAD-dependent epimerase/dehydratase family protein [Patescibacteria group bacterium]